MDSIKIRFGDENAFFSNVERTLENIFRHRQINPMFNACEYSWTPSMDVYETPQEIMIRAELAGVSKEDLQVEVGRDSVRVAGKRLEMKRDANGTYRLAEIQYGRFERILYLPAPIDSEVVSSSLSEGILQIRLAKLPTNIAHKVPISEG